MKLVNLTPHAVTLLAADCFQARPVVVEPDGRVARVADTVVYHATLLLRDDGNWDLTHDRQHGRDVVESGNVTYLEVTESWLGEVTDLPDAMPGTCYIVSRMVAEAMPGRRDLLFPTDVRRLGNGQIAGAGALGQVAPR